MPVYKVEICGVNTSKLPLLSNEEKEELFRRILKGDREAREQYIKGNLRLVLSVIRAFRAAGKMWTICSRLAVSASSRRLIILILPRMSVFRRMRFR